MMRTLRLRNIGWCEMHGHPVATLGVDGDSAFVGVAISVADAQAMSVASVSALQLGTQGGAADCCRVYGLLELVMGSLGGRVKAIDLSVGTDRIVRSWLKLEGPLGACYGPSDLLGRPGPVADTGRPAPDRHRGVRAPDGRPSRPVSPGTRSQFTGPRWP